VASSKSPPIIQPGHIPGVFASCAPYYERTRLYLRRFLAFLKPWEARNDTKGGAGLLTDQQDPAVTIDSHVVRVLVRTGYAGQRAEALARLDEELARPLPPLPGAAPEKPAADLGSRFAELARQLSLTPLEVDLCWLLLLPELVPDILWIYRTIWSDAAQVCCSEDFLRHVLDPYGTSPVATRDVLAPQARPFSLLLLEEVEVHPARGERYLRASRRLVDHLLGRDALAPELAGLCRPVTAGAARGKGNIDGQVFQALAELLRQRLASATHPARGEGELAPATMFHFFGPPEAGRRSLARELAVSVDRTLLQIDVPALAQEPDPLLQLRRARREAFLGKGLLLLADAEPLAEERHATLLQAVKRFLEAQSEPVFLIASSRLAAAGRLADELVPLEVRPPSSERREALWKQALGELPWPVAEEVRARDLARKFNLPPGKIRRAAQEALSLARLRGTARTVQPRDLHAAATGQLVHGLGSVADRIEKTLDWDDLILPDDCLQVLEEIVRRYRHQSQVMNDWGFRSKFVYGLGMSVLFSGPPGTGKTMTAGVLARELDMELFRIDLSRIVSKWIGETEKNLAKVFDEGKASQAIILFDEADSLFGKRGEVKSSVDRYSNLEINYLLQRMESYEGISILTTNQSQAMDEAFMRRIAFNVSFPLPDEATRERLWRSMIPRLAPLAADVDFQVLAERFEFSGGYIKNTILRAAFSAAEERSGITQRLLVLAAIEEARGLGRLLRVEDLLEELEVRPRRPKGRGKKPGSSSKTAPTGRSRR